MLRASSHKTGRPVYLRALVDEMADPLLEWGRELLAFTDAAVLRDTDEMLIARESLLAVGGQAAVVRVAAVAGNFEMMNRLLDAIGVPVGGGGVDIAEELGVEVPEHLRPA